jgi:hypothetical protein
MSTYSFKKSMPGEPAHIAFDSFPQRIYDTSSPYFKLVNQPVIQHLEGCYTMYQDKELVGRFALYENSALNYQGERTAAIGSYECIDELEVSEHLLAHAKNILRSKGYIWIIGPMEGSTWNNYRFSDHNDHPNFFMEPYHHGYYNQQFSNAGFQKIAKYYSNLAESPDLDVDKLDQFEKHYAEQGAVFRKLNLHDFANELKKIAELSLEGFSDNFLYTPITVEDFVSKYEKLEHLFDPELVWIVEDQVGKIHAFVFCIKDFFDETESTLIVKSVVRKLSSPFKGIGSYLAKKTIAMAKKGGYSKTIHALIKTDNFSIQLSEHAGSHTENQYKSYSLYGQKL